MRQLAKGQCMHCQCRTLTRQAAGALRSVLPYSSHGSRDLNTQADSDLSAGCLKAAAHVHGEGVVHESIGLGAFMMSTLDDAQADRLFMKLDNFGVAKAYTGASGPDSALAKGIKRDQEALAITFCELVFGVGPQMFLYGGCVAPIVSSMLHASIRAAC